MSPLFLLFIISVARGSDYAANTNHVSEQKANIALPISLSDDTATAPPAIALIEADAQGLLMPSETDAPLSVKYWPTEKTELSSAAVAVLADQKLDAPVETKTVAEFFENAATIEDWMSDDEKATALRFQKLSETLQTQLENPRVYLFGARQRDVVIIGKVKGGFGGIVTLVVET